MWAVYASARDWNEDSSGCDLSWQSIRSVGFGMLFHFWACWHLEFGSLKQWNSMTMSWVWSLECVELRKNIARQNHIRESMVCVVYESKSMSIGKYCMYVWNSFFVWMHLSDALRHSGCLLEWHWSSMDHRWRLVFVLACWKWMLNIRCLCLLCTLLFCMCLLLFSLNMCYCHCFISFIIGSILYYYTILLYYTILRYYMLLWFSKLICFSVMHLKIKNDTEYLESNHINIVPNHNS